MFKCRCGHGFLRKDLKTFKVEVAAAQPPPAPGAEKKKNLPKLNVAAGLCSQKGIGQYFKDPNSYEMMTVNVKSQTSKTKETSPEAAPAKKTTIPGLITGDQAKPLKLNMNLHALKSTQMHKTPSEAPIVTENSPKIQNEMAMPIDSSPTAKYVANNTSRIINPISKHISGSSSFKFIPPALRFPSPPNDQSSRKSSVCNIIDEAFSQSLLPGDIFESDGEDDKVPSSYKCLDIGRVTLPDLARRSSQDPTQWQTVTRHPAVLSPRGDENLESYPPNLVRKNIELLQQNVGLREENVALKMTNNQMMEDRKKLLNALSETMGEVKRREIEMKQLYDIFVSERNSSCFLRGLLLEPISNPVVASDPIAIPSPPDEEFLLDLVEEADEASSDSGVSENDIYQVNQKLDELDTSSKSIATNQNRTEAKISDLDQKVQILAAENVKFKKDIEKMRSFLRLVT